MNELLRLPVTTEDMVCRISMRGIEVSKVGRYKKRHYGSNDVYECPGSRFYLKKDYKKLFPNEFTKRKTAKKSANQRVIERPGTKQKSFIIDKKTVTKRLSTYWRTVKGEKLFYFWTVTFPQGTSEVEGHRLFNIWLTRMRTEMRLKSYLWIKERQQNGTIHFHMAVHQRMNVVKANRFMRASIMKAIDEGQINWSRTAAKNYNGVDIAKDRKTRRVVNFAKQNKAKALSNYLTKYVTKNTESFELLAWHCSRSYSNIITSVALTRIEVKQYLLHHSINKEKYYENDYFTIYYWNNAPPKHVLNYFELINDHIRTILNLHS